MSRSSRLRPAALGLSAVGLLFACNFAAPAAIRTLGLDVWNLPEAERELQAAQQEQDQLDVERGYALDQDFVTRQHIDDLITGRIRLPAAARERWDMSQYIRGFRHHLEQYYEDAGGDAKAAHNLIELACSECPATARDAVHGRLTREYEEAYGRPMPAN